MLIKSSKGEGKKAKSTLTIDEGLGGVVWVYNVGVK